VNREDDTVDDGFSFNYDFNKGKKKLFTINWHLCHSNRQIMTLIAMVQFIFPILRSNMLCNGEIVVLVLETS
jgi:hypothetical protein